MRNANAVCRHTVDCCLQCIKELRKILLVDIVDIDRFGTARNCLGIEFQRIGNLDGICTESAQEQFGIVKIVKIIYGIARAEFNALNLLQVDEICLLRGGGDTAVFDAAKGFCKRLAKLSREKRGHGRVIHLVIAGLGGKVYHLAAVNQKHELIVIYMNDRAV